MTALLQRVLLYLEHLAHGGTRRIHVAGRRYLFTFKDHVVKHELKRLTVARRAGEPAVRLVTFRQDFRNIVGLRPIAGLVACLEWDDQELTRIAIWLLGRCGKSDAVPAVARLRDDQDPAVRKEVTKALRRMRAWTELQAIAVTEPEESVRRFGYFHVPSAFSQRLSRYSQHMGEATERGQRVPRAPMPLLFKQPIGSGRPPKPASFIRRILEHIRLLVRGHPLNES